MDPSVVIEHIMSDLAINEFSVKATLNLLAKGATVPFIARYRKEATGELDELQIRSISEKFTYYAELESRKLAVIKSIETQGKMTDELKKKIAGCKRKYVLEDLYLPFKPRERTRAVLARESGLGGLADIILKLQPASGNKDEIVRRFIDPAKGVSTAEQAVSGASDIVTEIITEDPDLRSSLRALFLSKGVLISKATYAAAGTKTKYETYYNFAENLAKAPSHRLLAIRRGAKEKILSWEIDVREDDVMRLVIGRFVKDRRSVFHTELLRSIDTAYRRSLKTSLEVEAFRLRLEDAEKEAMGVFSKNLRNLLLAPPAGRKVIMGIDPGIATGAKVAVVGRLGEFIEYRQIFLHGSDAKKEEARRIVADLVNKHGVELVAVGNGTASRETFKFMNETIKETALAAKALVVSEAGASVYSASDAARLEFPDLDVTIRGAISIARRLQDPLADLVKIDPKSIGVGQYQHDVNQTQLKRALDATVESCVNFVGVELNTASAELLSYVAGIGPVISRSIVSYRNSRGPFKEKKDLLKVPLLRADIFEQCAGFLKIREGSNPLDGTTIHPERFGLVGRMAADLAIDIKDLIGNEDAISRVDTGKYACGDVGMPTLTDIINELKKPGVDPRDDFESVEFSDAVNDIDDLVCGSTLTGVVTNVTNFGAFVDIGIHNDGLVHISRMSDKFIDDPHKVVAVGDRIKVKVISIDKALDRVGLELIRQK